MNLFALSWSYIRTKPLNTMLNIVLLSLGIAIITLLLLLTKQIETVLTKNSQGIDLVVGAKGSPMQIILSSVFHIDFPTGNISLEEASNLSRNRLIRNAIPLALGDSYQGYRIVGTSHDYLDLYDAQLSTGTIWQEKMETVLGANVARELNLKVGDEFYGGHGLVDDNLHVHEDQGYQVTGILSADYSVVDNLILTSVESVWAVHDTHAAQEDAIPHEEEPHAHESSSDSAQAITTKGLPQGDADNEITSLILQYRSPMAAVQLPRYVNERTNMQAASPPFETARLFSLVGIGVDMIKGLAFLIIFIAGLSIFIALYNALKERRYDLAVMRSLGASRRKLLVHVILEGVIITTIGSFFGLLLGHGALMILAHYFVQSAQLGTSTYTLISEELYILLGSLFIGLFAALLPAINAYKTNISQVLAQGH